MNIFIIPSWYPSPSNPVAGIFFKEQAMAIAHEFEDFNIGISTWGQNDERLLLWSKSPIKILYKLTLKLKSVHRAFGHNFYEYFTPAFTWTRKLAKGNISGIIKANELNFLNFQEKVGKIDVIHAHVAYPGAYVAMKLAEKYSIPFVITEHMSPFPFSTFLAGDKLLKPVETAFSKSALNIAVSQALKGKMAHYGIETIVIPNLVDETFFLPGKTSSSNSPIEILSIGRLEEQKGYTYLLDAFQLIKQQYPDIKLKVIGDGTLKNQLIRKTHSLNLHGAVCWAGFQTREQVRNALQKCTFLTLASTHENLPLVLLEALACGKPIISTRCEGPEDIVNEKNGRLAEPRNADDMFQQMAHLIDHLDSYDSNIIRKDFENRYSKRIVCDKILYVYEQAIASYSKK